MGKPSKTYLTFELNDQFFNICSFKESNKGELIILPKFAENYSETEFGNPHSDQEIEDQHYTIHHKRQINQYVSVINHTLKYKNGTQDNTRIYTRSFDNKLFCPIFLVRGQDFSIERYICTKNDRDKYISLGKYTPKQSTVYYMIVASKPKSKFKGRYEDLNIINLDFKNYSIILLWSFGMIPSHSTGSKGHFLTLSDHSTQLKEGYEEVEVINLYRYFRQKQHISFLEFIKEKIKVNEIDFKLIQGIRFKKKPELKIDDSDKASMRINLGLYLYLKGIEEYNDGMHGNAIKYFSESKKIFKLYNELLFLADVLNSEGVLYQKIGMPNQAIEAYDEALSIYQKIKLNFNAARTYLNISQVYRDTSKVEIAIDKIQKSIRISEENKYYSLMSRSYQELGVLYKNNGDFILAQENLDKALNSYKKDNNKEGEAFCLGNMGLIEFSKGNFLKSLQLHNEALCIFTTLSNQLGIANETANIGNVNCVLGNEDGLDQLKHALEMHKKNGYKYGIATDLKLIGIHLINKRERMEGIEFLEKSKNVLLKIENSQEARIIAQLIDEVKSNNV